MGELAAGLAHEIGNPLAAISGSVQMLSGNFKGDEPQRKLIDILLKESYRLDRTIKGFLRFARPEQMSMAPVDLQAVIARAIEDVPGAAAAVAGRTPPGRPKRRTRPRVRRPTGPISGV